MNIKLHTSMGLIRTVTMNRVSKHLPPLSGEVAAVSGRRGFVNILEIIIYYILIFIILSISMHTDSKFLSISVFVNRKTAIPFSSNSYVLLLSQDKPLAS